MKGYKVFNEDWTCRGFKYEVGETYEMEESPKCCNRGFHFCTNLADCFNYYDFDTNNKVAEVEALGEIATDSDDTKHCTNKIKIVRELAWEEVLTLCNSGDWNSGNSNSGDWNSGDWNSGDWNSGDCNSGDWNSASFSNGCFNTKEPKIYLFDKPSDWTYQDWMGCNARYILNNMPNDYLAWVYSENMTDEEKEKHPEHETTGGFLRTVEKSKERQSWWDNLDEDRKRDVKAIPNFDSTIFKCMTGIDVNEGEEHA